MKRGLDTTGLGDKKELGEESIRNQLCITHGK